MISVCIATYNGERFVADQIKSIINQLSDTDEVIISDDGSTDRTLEIVRSLKDNRIKIISGSFHSPIFNFENAIKNAKGDFIFLADQDDVWCDNKVNTILPYLNKYPLVCTNARIVDQSLDTIRENFFEPQPLRGLIENIIRNPYLGCTMAFTKEMKNFILPFPNKIAMHDIWIGLCVEFFFKTYFINENLILYRRHGGNATNTGGEKSKRKYTERISYRLYMAYSLLKRWIEIKVLNKNVNLEDK